MPIIFSQELPTAIQVKPKHTFLNYRKADWASFTSLVKDCFSSFTVNTFSNLDSAANALAKVIRAASARSVPAGHVRRYNPSFTPEIRQLMRERTRLRSQLPTPHFTERVGASLPKLTERSGTTPLRYGKRSWTLLTIGLTIPNFGSWLGPQ